MSDLRVLHDQLRALLPFTLLSAGQLTTSHGIVTIDPTRIKQVIECIAMALDRFITCIFCDVKDLFPGQKIDTIGDIARTRALYEYLSTTCLGAAPAHVLIEHQPIKMGPSGKTNSQASQVSHQLAYHYIARGCDVRMVDPKAKNKFALGPGLDLATFMAQYQSKYTARKAHSKANFILLMDTFMLGHVYMHVPASVRDDLADSMMEIFAYLRENNMYTGVCG